jgi:integrase
MSARPQSAQPSNVLRLFDIEEPAEAGCAQDHTSCAHPEPAPAAPVVALPPVDLFQRVQRRDRKLQPTIPEADRQRVRQTLTLWEFWSEWLRPGRERQVAADKLAKSTLDKEISVLRRFRDWDLSHPPEDWPVDAPPWPGLPIGFLAEGRLEDFLTHEGKRKAAASIESDWNHLRTVLNAAVKLKAIVEAPAADLESVIEAADEDDDDDVATAFSEAELDGIYRRLPSKELQVAWVLGANAGPRGGDLLGLDWKRFHLDSSPPYFRFRARKTDKRHWIPLAPVTIAQLDRLREGRLFVEGPLFPSLMNHDCKDPGRSRPARRTIRLVKDAMKAIGIKIAGDYRKPWQVLRSTASTRLNDFRKGLGKLLTHGPDDNINARSYDDYRDRLTEGVMSIRQPSAFQQT